MLIEPCGPDEQDLGFIDFMGEIDGSGGEFLKMPAGGSRLPASVETVEKRQHYVHQEGQQVFKYAVRKMQEVCEALLGRNGFTGKDIQFLIPHQANRRIIDATVEKLGFSLRPGGDQHRPLSATPPAGTIGLAACDAYKDGKLKKGDLILFAAVGAGYTVGRRCGAGRSDDALSYQLSAISHECTAARCYGV